MSIQLLRRYRASERTACRSYGIEAMEKRVLLSVSGTSLAGPFNVGGNHWEYAAVDSSGDTNTFIETAAGATTFNGNACYQIDIGPAGASHSYVGTDAAGDYVSFGEVVTFSNNSQTSTDTYTPYALGLPAQMNPGTPYTSSYTDNSTQVDSTGTTTSNDTETDTITLLSGTTSPITVPAGAYDAYQIHESETTVSPGNDGTSITSTSQTDLWYVADIGYVKVIDYDEAGAVTATFSMTVFKNVNSKLQFIQSPQDTAVGDTLKPPVTVELLDASGNLQTGGTGSVILNLNAANTTGTGKLSGTLTEPLVGGIATFSDLSIDAGGKYALAASDISPMPALPVVSSQFTVTDGKLVFIKKPHDGSANAALNPGVTVELQDAKGKPITDEDGTIVTLATIGVTGGAALTGNTAALSGGVATFPALTFKKPGFYTLQASDGGDTEDTSKKFKITGDKLKFSANPKDGQAGAPLPLTVAIVDSHGKLVTTATSSVVLSLNTIKGGKNAKLTGVSTASFVGGLASFAGTSTPLINSAGTYTLTATEEDTTTGTLAPTNTTTPVDSAKFKIAGVTLKSITAALGSQKQKSTDDDLSITSANVIAVPQSNATMTLVGTGLSSNKPSVLGKIGWTLVRNSDDVASGATPTITRDASNPLQATVSQNGIGSFNAICYYDADSSGTYDDGEEIKVVHLAEVGVVVDPNAGSVTTSSSYYNAIVQGKQTGILSGDFVSQFGIAFTETARVVGGGADGMIGVDKIHLGYVQNGVADSVAVQYKGGAVEQETLHDGSFPELDSSYPANPHTPSSIYTLPPGLLKPLPHRPGPARDPVIGSDPAGGQDRSLRTADSPTISFFNNRTPTQPAESTSGSNTFATYLSAYSDDFTQTYAAYLSITWSASFVFAKSLLGNWSNAGSAVTLGAVSTLGQPQTLASLGVRTSGPQFADDAQII